MTISNCNNDERIEKGIKVEFKIAKCNIRLAETIILLHMYIAISINSLLCTDELKKKS